LERILHIHVPHLAGEIIDKIAEYDAFIAGGVFCEKTRIDRDARSWGKLIRGVKKKPGCGGKKVYIQQPFYLLEESEEHFLQLIKKWRTGGMIDGLLVNSPGMARTLSGMLEKDNIDDFEIIFSRFGIGKRRRTNKYLIQRLLDYRVSVFECFANDSVLVKDIDSIFSEEGVKGNPMRLWKRFNKNRFHSFSRVCFTALYSGRCIDDPGGCACGKYTLRNVKKDIELMPSGHIIYVGSGGSAGDAGECDAVVTDAEENEL
jgi:hypothetical protein